MKAQHTVASSLALGLILGFSKAARAEPGTLESATANADQAHTDAVGSMNPSNNQATLDAYAFDANMNANAANAQANSANLAMTLSMLDPGAGTVLAIENYSLTAAQAVDASLFAGIASVMAQLGPADQSPNPAGWASAFGDEELAMAQAQADQAQDDAQDAEEDNCAGGGACGSACGTGCSGGCGADCGAGCGGCGAGCGGGCGCGG
jgi:hypothetical protein